MAYDAVTAAALGMDTSGLTDDQIQAAMQKRQLLMYAQSLQNQGGAGQGAPKGFMAGFSSGIMPGVGSALQNYVLGQGRPAISGGGVASTTPLPNAPGTTINGYGSMFGPAAPTGGASNAVGWTGNMNPGAGMPATGWDDLAAAASAATNKPPAWGGWY